ncbi:phospholipase [Bacteroidia bacterium]|nr:phospholipase [Bacteroidia bacterium]
MKTTIKLFAALFAVLLFVRCHRVEEGRSNFTNLVYLQNAATDNTVALTFKSKDSVSLQTIQAALAQPAGNDVQLTYAADTSLVAWYRKAYGIECRPLADSLYVLERNEDVILAGDVRSTSVTLKLHKLNTMTRNVRYLLPITISEARGMGVMQGARTIFYLLNQGATINTVPYMGENYLKMPSMATSAAVQGLTQVTFETLIHPRAWKSISSIMGVEDYFLVRVGDTFPQDQMHLAYNNGNSAGPKLEAGKWQHLAITLDLPTRQLKWYIDGALKQTTTVSLSAATYPSLNLGANSKNTNKFFIGYSYDASRWFDGEMCEVRIWNVVRTQQEIADNFYEIDPATPGLVGYWKCDEGVGSAIRDHSPSGNNATSDKALTWVKVSLPATE